mmetsp:Transcript_65033/g.172182  ORF Transcript_65033/g.172182 Transcript_65033/m.172182 type:complete len:112 (-) Transcript_65033:1097-1432(-)
MLPDLEAPPGKSEVALTKVVCAVLECPLTPIRGVRPEAVPPQIVSALRGSWQLLPNSTKALNALLRKGPGRQWLRAESYHRSLCWTIQVIFEENFPQIMGVRILEVHQARM